jgi:hypothetical protein
MEKINNIKMIFWREPEMEMPEKSMPQQSGLEYL